MKTLYKITFLFVLLIFTDNIFAQQNERERGIELFRQGNNAEAARVLKNATGRKEFKTDAEVWNHLGLAYLNLEKNKDARKVLEKAVKLAPQNSIYRANLAYAYLVNNKADKAQSESNRAINLDPQNANAYFVRGTASLWEGKFDEAVADADRAVIVNPNFAMAYVLKSEGLLYSFGKAIAEGAKPTDKVVFLESAKAVLENCVQNCQKNTGIQERLEAIDAFYNYFRAKDSLFTPVSATEVNTTVVENTSPIKILAKPRANYTDSARQANKQGAITLAVLFAADGQVKHIIVLNGLGYGLDREAIRAAKNIRFEPARKDGKPISVVKMVQYNFSIY